MIIIYSITILNGFSSIISDIYRKPTGFPIPSKDSRTLHHHNSRTKIVLRIQNFDMINTPYPILDFS